MEFSSYQYASCICGYVLKALKVYFQLQHELFYSNLDVGSSYAMLTTFGNVALTCAYSIGSRLSTIWDVSNEAMRANKIDGEIQFLNLSTIRDGQ